MDYDNSAPFGFHNIFNPNFTWDYPEGTPFEYPVEHHDLALLSGTAEALEGPPSEISVGHESNAPTDPSTDADQLYEPEDQLEGTPEFSAGHISNTSFEPSLDEDILSDTEDDLEGTPSESSIGHDSNAPTAPSSDEDPYDAGSCRSPASGPSPTHFNHGRSRSSPTYHPTPKLRVQCSYLRPATRLSSAAHAAHAAVLTAPHEPAGTPTGSACHSQPPGKEQEGIPSGFEPRTSATATSHPAEADPANDREKQLARLLMLIAKRKQEDALIHVGAAESSEQLYLLMQKSLVFEIACDDARKWVEKAERIEDTWLTHLAALAHSDRDASATARRRYDRFCTEYGLYANLERAQELIAMLEALDRQVESHKRRLRALSGDQKNQAFTIVGKMPPVKLYKLPGTPGNHALPGRKSDTEGHGTPCTPSSTPTPDSGIASPCSDGLLLPAARKQPQRIQHAAPASQPRLYCVFCSCHEHWCSDCPRTDFQARWAFVKDFHLCQQCLRSCHRLADCSHANRRCLHCSARHNAALCPKLHGPAFRPAEPQPTPSSGRASVATAAGARSPPSPDFGTPSEAAHNRDDRLSTTNPLDTKPRSSSSAHLSRVSSEAAEEEPSDAHGLANPITSFFQRNSAGSDVVVGFYARTQVAAGRTFYRILKPLNPSFRPSCPVNDQYDHLAVYHVIMLETTARVLPCDPLLSSSAMPDADSRHSTRRSSTDISACSSCCDHPTEPGVVATDLSGVAPRPATVMSELATAMRTPLLPRLDALSPTTTDSAPTELEPKNSRTASRRPRRKRQPRSKLSAQARSTPSTQSALCMTMSSLGATTFTAGSIDPARLLVANSEAIVTPLGTLECDDDEDVHVLTPTSSIPRTSDRQLPLKRVRTWTASSRKKAFPELSPLATSDHTSLARGGPSTLPDSTGTYIAQGNKESGTPPTFFTPPTVYEGGGNPLPPPEDAVPTNEDSPTKDNTTAPHTIEDRTSTEPTSRVTASSSRGRRGSSGRRGPATRRRW